MSVRASTLRPTPLAVPVALLSIGAAACRTAGPAAGNPQPGRPQSESPQPTRAKPPALPAREVAGVTFEVVDVEREASYTSITVRIRNRSGTLFDLHESGTHTRIVTGDDILPVRSVDRALWDNPKWGMNQPNNTTAEGRLVFPPVPVDSFTLVLQGDLGDPPVEANHIQAKLDLRLGAPPEPQVP